MLKHQLRMDPKSVLFKHESVFRHKNRMSCWYSGNYRMCLLPSWLWKVMLRKIWCTGYLARQNNSLTWYKGASFETKKVSCISRRILPLIQCSWIFCQFLLALAPHPQYATYFSEGSHSLQELSGGYRDRKPCSANRTPITLFQIQPTINCTILKSWFSLTSGFWSHLTCAS